MANFAILTGKALSSAIAGRAKQVSTFTEREHQLAYSALHHVELHNCPSHLNALLAVTPVNYRAGLIAWAKAFGKVSFDVEAKAFAYAKAKESNMPGAMEIAPANFQKSGGKPKADKSLMERVESMAAKVAKDDKASTADRAFAKALANFLTAHKASLARPVRTSETVKLIKAKATEKPAAKAKAKEAATA